MRSITRNLVSSLDKCDSEQVTSPASSGKSIVLIYKILFKQLGVSTIRIIVGPKDIKGKRTKNAGVLKKCSNSMKKIFQCNDSYRGIMLLSIPGKVLSKIILNRMKKYCR